MMRKIATHFLVLYLICFVTLPVPALAQDRIPSGDTRVVVIPLNTKQPYLNSVNTEMANALRDNLKQSFQVMQVQDVARIIKNQSASPSAPYQYDPTIISMIQSAADAYGLKQDAGLAVRLFDEAIAAIQKQPGFNRALSALYVSTLFNKAFVLFCAGRTAEAAQIVSDVYKINPKVIGDLGGFSTAFIAFVGEQGKGSAKSDEGTITLTGVPASFDVLVNGVFVGTAPFVYSLPAGSYSITFCAEGRKSTVKKVNVKANTNQTLSANLAWTGNAQTQQALNDDYSGLTEDQKLALLTEVSASTGADKVVLLDVAQNGEVFLPRALVYDSAHHQAFKPVTYSKIAQGSLKTESPKVVSHFARKIRPYINKDAARLYKGDYSGGSTDTTLAARGKKPITKKPAFWIGLGTVVLGGVITAILVSNSKSGGGDGQGSLSISFDPFK